MKTTLNIDDEIPPLPTFHSGGTFVDVADWDALYEAMEGPSSRSSILSTPGPGS
jgi:hypothetical protein